MINRRAYGHGVVSTGVNLHPSPVPRDRVRFPHWDWLQRGSPGLSF
jgi:hypothetical protein